MVYYLHHFRFDERLLKSLYIGKLLTHKIALKAERLA